MPIETWFAYLATVLVLMSTPGPSHMLMLSNSLSHGFPRSIATAAGDLSANVMQILAAGLGLAALLSATKYGFTIVKWAGVAYLVFLGIKQIAASFELQAQGVETPPTSTGRLWMQGFVTSAANPKAVVFFAALFPQFLSDTGSLWLEITILGITYLLLDALFLSAYGASAGWLGTKLRGPSRVWIERVAGGCIIGAAILLGLKTARQT